jgi:hypothetical protein
MYGVVEGEGALKRQYADAAQDRRTQQNEKHRKICGSRRVLSYEAFPSPWKVVCVTDLSV